jgi:replicative DNA helicase
MSECHTLSEVLPGFFDDLLRGAPPVVYDTGIIPVRQGEVVAITAPPGAGKTCLVMAMTFDALHGCADLSAVVANVEMSWQQLVEREVSRSSGVPYDWIRTREFRGVPDLVARVESAQTAIAQVAARMTFVSPPMTLEAVDRTIDDTGARWVVLDYLQRIPPYDDPARNPPDTRLRVNEAMCLVRGLADQGRAVLVVSAASRGSGKAAYADMGLGSFRESSELEFGADTVFTLNTEEAHYLLRCHKSRFGRRHDIHLDFDGEHQRFTRIDGGTSHA